MTIFHSLIFCIFDKKSNLSFDNLSFGTLSKSIHRVNQKAIITIPVSADTLVPPIIYSYYCMRFIKDLYKTIEMKRVLLLHNSTNSLYHISE